MKVAYADPPYLGKCGFYQHTHWGELCWDKKETHKLLIEHLCCEFPDGWALSTDVAALSQMLRYCPDFVRIGAWVKPFASFKTNVTPAYAWEPVIFTGGRRRSREQWSGRDWVSAMPPVFSGEHRRFGSADVPGMKPATFCNWLFVDIFGLQPDDELVDLFPGSGAVTSAWRQFQRQGSLFQSVESVDLSDFGMLI
jgi:hypothetical protein